MRLITLALGLAACGLVGCADRSDEDDLASSEGMLGSDPRPFDAAAMAAQARRTFATPSGVTEVCVIAKHFSEDGFQEKDRKKEEKLCRFDWNAAPGGETIAAGLVPKANSTNPATDVHEVSDALGRDVVESFAEANKRQRRAKKLGRLKSSLDSRFSATASYAPSIVGYYATSRMLGNIAEVTPAVWRTLDVKRHAKVAEQGQGLTVIGSQNVRKLWKTFVAADNASGRKTALTYTSDGAQVYGALIPSVSGDAKDKEIDTLPALTGAVRFRRLTDARPIASTLPRDFKGAVEAIIPMQGVVEMLVLDALMLQGDRLSGDNVSFVPFMYFQKPDGSIDRMSKDDFDDLAKSDPGAVPAGAVAVRKLYLNDVDAGLIVKNADQMQAGVEFSQLKKISHVSPDLYVRVQKLGKMVDEGALETFAKTEWRFTDRDWTRYQTMAKAVARLLHDRCTAGTLTLDLDIAKHVAGTNLGPREGCD
jgi:hypothetical protein